MEREKLKLAIRKENWLPEQEVPSQYEDKHLTCRSHDSHYFLIGIYTK